jgi:5'(3')-deoxyribonucleotidase
MKKPVQQAQGKPIIAVDIDDVLSRSAQAVVAYSNEHWGHSLTADDFNERLAEMWQVEEKEAERRWTEYMASGNFGIHGVVADAKTVLESLRNRYQLIAVTSRRGELADITQEWLDSNYPGLVERVVHSGFYGKGNADAHQMTKADILTQMGARYLIDDQPKHCIGAAEVGIRAVLFGDYGWNRDIMLPAGVVRCKDWAAVQEYFNGTH